MAIVREATKDDVKTCAKIEKQSSTESIEIIEDEIEKQIGDEDHFIYVAEEDGKVIGFISAEWQRWNNSVFIDSLYIDEGYRRKGYGSLLLKQMIQKSREIRAKKVFIDVEAGNKNAIILYLRHGFEINGYVQDFYRSKKEGNAVFLVLYNKYPR
ncbi:Spermine/spermidine acetyltransferase [bacterium HR37]|jgi:ribosomal protein S18 acetylase RimI-like enzyme|nr:Spermine/spermidine acetyltransferase [bacterium HR37]